MESARGPSTARSNRTCRTRGPRRGKSTAAGPNSTRRSRGLTLSRSASGLLRVLKPSVMARGTASPRRFPSRLSRVALASPRRVLEHRELGRPRDGWTSDAVLQRGRFYDMWIDPTMRWPARSSVSARSDPAGRPSRRSCSAQLGAAPRAGVAAPSRLQGSSTSRPSGEGRGQRRERERRSRFGTQGRGQQRARERRSFGTHGRAPGRRAT